MMLLKKSVILPLLFVFFLAGCSGSDGFGLGNGEGGDTGGSTGGTDNTGGSGDTTEEVIPQLGSGSGDAFDAGVLTTTLAGGGELSYGGSTTSSASLVDSNDGNSLIATPMLITFSSACAEQGLATIGASATTTAGVATVSYTATSCTGSDTITATAGEGNSIVTASVTFDISSLD